MSDGKQRSYYTCQEVVRYGSSCKCDVRNLPGQDFDSFVVKAIREIGKRPEELKSALKDSQKSGKRSMREHKVKLAFANKELGKLDDEIGRLIDLAKAKGRKGFGETLLEEADSLLADKRKIVAEREALKGKIQYGEKAIAGEKVIAEALTNFEDLYKRSPFEKRAELANLLIRQIKVSRFVPKKEDLPTGFPMAEGNIRTSWYRIDFSFLVRSLFRSTYKKGQKSSYLVQGGGERGIRTT
jgi:hypothetical protein